MQQEALPRVELAHQDALAATTSFPSVFTRRRDGFKSMVRVANSGGTTPTFDVVIQESGDDPDVPDASANWNPIVTVAQIAGDGVEWDECTAHHFARLRAVVTLGGGSPVGDVLVVIQ